MERLARNTFVLLTIVFAFALQCNSAAQNASVTPAQGNSTTVIPAPVNTTPVIPQNASVSISTDISPKIETTTLKDNTLGLIEIEVYYEALCSDSVKFVSTDLLPVYNKLSMFITVTFIPFALGHITVNTDKPSNLTCKREGECAADRVHACAIHKIKDNKQLINFVNCSLTKGFNDSNKTVPISVCGQDCGIESAIITEITNCANSSESDQWLENYETKSKTAEVISVPTVKINKNSTEPKSETLIKEICKKIPDDNLPAVCKPTGSGSNTIVVGVLPIIIGAFYFMKMI